MNHSSLTSSNWIVSASVLAALVHFGTATIIAQDVKPALEPLKHYVGTWDSELEIISDKPADSTKKIKGTVTGKWAVGGSFLEQTGEYELGGGIQPLVIKTMMVYNKSTRRFDYYYFYSSGEVYTGVTTWSSEEKILTTLAEDKEGRKKFEVTADFSKPGVEKWLIVFKDNNRVKLKVKGRNVLRKEKQAP